VQEYLPQNPGRMLDCTRSGWLDRDLAGRSHSARRCF
jgi:hypothetical protein